MAVTWDRTAARCLCGKRKTVNVVIEYVKDGRVDYAGGRYCYDAGTQIQFAIPRGRDADRAEGL